VTLNLPGRIGNTADTAVEAARLHAAANAAVHVAGFAPGTENTDRKDHQTAPRIDGAASPARAVGQLENAHEGRVRTSSFHVRRGPSLGFVAQMLAQDEHADIHRQVTPAEGAATYPSLVSDIDIFLPGEDIVLADASRRLDIHV